jgi:hypothetical protein
MGEWKAIESAQYSASSIGVITFIAKLTIGTFIAKLTIGSL